MVAAESARGGSKKLSRPANTHPSSWPPLLASDPGAPTTVVSRHATPSARIPRPASSDTCCSIRTRAGDHESRAIPAASPHFSSTCVTLPLHTCSRPSAPPTPRVPGPSSFSSSSFPFPFPFPSISASASASASSPSSAPSSPLPLPLPLFLPSPLPLPLLALPLPLPLPATADAVPLSWTIPSAIFVSGLNGRISTTSYCATMVAAAAVVVVEVAVEVAVAAAASALRSMLSRMHESRASGSLRLIVSAAKATTLATSQRSG